MLGIWHYLASYSSLCCLRDGFSLRFAFLFHNHSKRPNRAHYLSHPRRFPWREADPQQSIALYSMRDNPKYLEQPRRPKTIKLERNTTIGSRDRTPPRQSAEGIEQDNSDRSILYRPRSE